MSNFLWNWRCNERLSILSLSQFMVPLAAAISNLKPATTTSISFSPRIWRYRGLVVWSHRRLWAWLGCRTWLRRRTQPQSTALSKSRKGVIWWIRKSVKLWRCSFSAWLDCHDGGETVSVCIKNYKFSCELVWPYCEPFDYLGDPDFENTTSS